MSDAVQVEESEFWLGLRRKSVKHIFLRGSMTKTLPSLDSNQSSSANETSTRNHSATADARSAAEIRNNTKVKKNGHERQNMFVTGRNHFTIIAKSMLANHDSSN